MKQHLQHPLEGLAGLPGSRRPILQSAFSAGAGASDEAPGTNPFELPGQWFKGALHVHTNRSDGHLSPEEAMEAHRDHGYHFMALTDHNVITDISALGDEGFVNIPSVEVTCGRNALGQRYHLVVLGVRSMVALPPQAAVQETIQAWSEAGALIFLAHTYWSGMVASEILDLDKLAGLEVYNTSADTDLGKGLASIHWDDALARGKRWWGIAVDDTHWMSQDGWFYDTFGGWVWVKAQTLSEASILGALRRGEFYASSGPEIHDFGIANGVARLKCSPVRSINFVGHTQWGLQHRAEPGQAITEAKYLLTGRERYLRAECTDAQGRTAWTNPIFL